MLRIETRNVHKHDAQDPIWTRDLDVGFIIVTALYHACDISMQPIIQSAESAFGRCKPWTILNSFYEALKIYESFVIYTLFLWEL